MNEENEKIYEWLNSLFSNKFTVTPIAGDASLRKYYRVFIKDMSYVIMQAPVDKSWQQYLRMSDVLDKHNINIPKRLDINGKEGLILLSDFGDMQYLKALNNKTADTLYNDAFETLIDIQSIDYKQYPTLDYLDADLMQKQIKEVFCYWYLESFLKIKITDELLEALNINLNWLIKEIEQIPKVIVHFDYHSRNLMKVKINSPGVLDFQDALVGPITYDLVSLLQDCYIQWPRSWVELWVNNFRQMLIKRKMIHDIPQSLFLRCFDLVGLQRHLKNLGVFSRLYIRDNKKQYVDDMPNLLSNILMICQSHSELNTWNSFLQKYVFSSLSKELSKKVVNKFTAQGMIS